MDHHFLNNNWVIYHFSCSTLASSQVAQHCSLAEIYHCTPKSFAVPVHDVQSLHVPNLESLVIHAYMRELKMTYLQQIVWH